MSARKAFGSFAFLVIPLVLLFVYWEYTYFNGHPIEQTIPKFSIFLALAVLLVLEFGFRYKKAVSQKGLAIRDVASTAVNVLFTTTIGASFFVPIVVFLPELLFGRSLFFGSAAQLGPLWLQLILVVALFSFMRYWIHRIQHIVPFLWELHSYHHSVTDLKASNTFVSHPIDYSLRNVFPPVFLGVVGFDPVAITFGVGLLNAAGLMSHCGAGLHAGWLTHFFAMPEVHRWHHSAEVPEGHRYSVNYGVGLILWDRLFGTYYLPKKDGQPVQPDKLGHPGGLADEGNYLKLFFLTRYLPKFTRKPSAE
ncbi:MAG TPA: sterol desaturase family protein [Gammaproteobacteria bacterium]|nr:sterol desaturase family protein [Gammaproteobacteria bacterium]